MTIVQLDCIRDNFVKTLKSDVDSLIRLHNIDVGTPGRPGRWMQSVKRSAIVLIAANLENYIEELLCSALSHLADEKVHARKYPENFRLWQFRQMANMRSLSDKDSKDLINLTLKLYSEVRPLEKEELMLDKIREKFSNPTPDNVNWIMGLLDKSDYCRNARVVVNKKNIIASKALAELSQRRNDIAHGEAGQNPDISDVERLSRFSFKFSMRIKKDVIDAIEPCLK